MFDADCQHENSISQYLALIISQFIQRLQSYQCLDDGTLCGGSFCCESNDGSDEVDTLK